MREVMIVAGEPSGDLHAAGMSEALRHTRADVALTGVGGAAMAQAGVELLERTDTMSVMGFVEVMRRIPHHYALLGALRRRLESGRVAVLVVIDYPGFNMRLAAAACRANVPVVYYITPQVWAWGERRLPRLARVITKAAVILPFEEELLRMHGIDATFVGHPLLDRIGNLPSRDEARRRLGIAQHGPVLALFPGSRQQEIDRHVDAFAATARVLQRRYPDLQVLVSVAPGVTLDTTRCPFPQVAGDSLTVLRAADAALCKSGTTTLEAAVSGCPLIVAYRTSTWTHAIARRVVKIPNIGLVNVVAGHTVAREFVQNDVQPEAMALALAPMLDRQSAARAKMLADLDEVKRRLGSAGAAQRVAAMVSELVP